MMKYLKERMVIIKTEIKRDTSNIHCNLVPKHSNKKQNGRKQKPTQITIQTPI